MTLLMADITPAGRDWPEAEPVTVNATRASVELVLDDGTRILLAADELREAITDSQATEAA